MSSLLKLKTFCVITGASRGLGKAIAFELARVLPPSSTLLLLARSVDDLASVKSSILSEKSGVSVVTKYMDQSKLDTDFRALLSNVLTEENLSPGNFEQAMIVHNCGVLGDVTKLTADMTGFEMVRETMDINVSGMILLNAAFLQVFPNTAGQTRTVINISSLAALLPFASQSLYCAGKACRDMFFRVVAKEEPSVRVLNYAPGPLATDMQAQTRQSKDPETRQMFIDLQDKDKLLTCEFSVSKLFVLLERNSFESGDHIDIYDIE